MTSARGILIVGGYGVVMNNGIGTGGAGREGDDCQRQYSRKQVRTQERNSDHGGGRRVRALCQTDTRPRSAIFLSTSGRYSRPVDRKSD